ncbi:MAG TPA: hypothetical protein VF808_16320 [Ktedonobacterales bacterium]
MAPQSYAQRRVAPQSYAQRRVEAQTLLAYTINGEDYPRVRYGAESTPWDASHPCHDCAPRRAALPRA